MPCHHCVVRPATNSRGHPCARPDLASRPPTAVSVSSFSQVVAGRDDSPPRPWGRHGDGGASAVPAHRPGVPRPAGQDQRAFRLVRALAWQDRSRLRRPVTARREEGQETAMFHADLHIHSRFSRTCSRDCDIPQLAAGALRKGISVVGAGDFTHPAWADELKSSLVPAEAGLLRLRPDPERDLRRRVPAGCEQPVRFMLSLRSLLSIAAASAHGKCIT